MSLELLELLKNVGVVHQGHFVLKSMQHSEYFVDLGDLDRRHPEIFDVFCRRLTEHLYPVIIAKTRVVIVGIASGGNPIAVRVASLLEDQYGVSVECVVTKKDELIGPVLASLKSYTKLRRAEVVIVDDILTKGTTVKNCVPKLLVAGAVAVRTVGVLWNRGDVSAETLGVPHLRAVLTHPIETMTAEECMLRGPCSRGISINTTLGHGTEYLRTLRSS